MNDNLHDETSCVEKVTCLDNQKNTDKEKFHKIQSHEDLFSDNCSRCDNVHG